MFEPRHEKTCLQSFRPGRTQIGLFNHRGWLEACNLGFKKKRDCTFYGADQLLVCAFVFAYIYAKNGFSHDAAHFNLNKLSEFSHPYKLEKTISILEIVQ